MCLRHLYHCKRTFGPSIPACLCVLRAVVSIKLNDIQQSKFQRFLLFCLCYIELPYDWISNFVFPELKISIFLKKKYPVYITEGAPY